MRKNFYEGRPMLLDDQRNTILVPKARMGSLVKIALFVWILLTLLALGRAALWNHARHQGCYQVFEEAGRNWLHADSLYDHKRALNVFHYSPVAACLFAPLGLVPTALGNFLLRCVNILIFLPALWWWVRQGVARSWTTNQRAAFFLWLAVFGGNSYLDIQVNVLMTGLLLLTMVALAREQWLLAALACSLTIHLKAYPLALALLLCVVYPRPFALRWLLMMSLWALLPFLCQDPAYVAQQYEDWFCFGMNRRFEEYPFDDVMRFYKIWIGAMSRMQYSLLEFVVGTLMALFCLYQRWRQQPADRLQFMLLGFSCVWMTAFGPATEGVTYILIAPVCAASAILVWARSSWLVRGLIIVSNGIFALAQLELLFPLDKPLHQIGALPFSATLLLLALVLQHLPFSLPRAYAIKQQAIPSSLPAA